MSNFLHHYVVVRRDIPHGKQLVHAVHAAGESFYEFPRSSEERAPEYPEAGGSNPSGGAFDISRTHAVLLGAKNEAALLALEARLIAAKLEHVAIREISEDAWNGQLVSIGAVPFLRTPELKALFKGLRCVL